MTAGLGLDDGHLVLSAAAPPSQAPSQFDSGAEKKIQDGLNLVTLGDKGRVAKLGNARRMTQVTSAVREHCCWSD